MRLTLKDKSIITNVYHFINANLWTHYPIRHFVSAYKIDESTLIRFYKQHYDETPYHHRLQAMMTWAERKIYEGHQIKAIANELGFSKTTNFSRTFKRVLGYPPSDASRI